MAIAAENGGNDGGNVDDFERPIRVFDNVKACLRCAQVLRLITAAPEVGAQCCRVCTAIERVVASTAPELVVPDRTHQIGRLRGVRRNKTVSPIVQRNRTIVELDGFNFSQAVRPFAAVN